MVSGRFFAAFLAAFSTALAGLAAASLYLWWVHEAEMRRVMGGMMHGMMMPWMPLALVALFVVAATVPVIFYALALDKVSVRVAGLTSPEQAVVNYLLRNGGQATQKEIAQTLNISRLKAHRLVESLKRRGVVATTPLGRARKVTLVKDHKPEQL